MEAFGPVALAQLATGATEISFSRLPAPKLLESVLEVDVACAGSETLGNIMTSISVSGLGTDPSTALELQLPDLEPGKFQLLLGFGTNMAQVLEIFLEGNFQQLSWAEGLFEAVRS